MKVNGELKGAQIERLDAFPSYHVRKRIFSISSGDTEDVYIDTGTSFQRFSQGGGEPNVQSDFDETNTASDAYIKNKPTPREVPATGDIGKVLKKTGIGPLDYDFAPTDGGRVFLPAYGDRVPGIDFSPLDPLNLNPDQIWSDGQLFFVLDSVKKKLFVYDITTRERNQIKEIPLDGTNAQPQGLSGDAGFIYVLDGALKKAFAYNRVTLARDVFQGL